MNIVVIGAGEVGFHLTRLLSKEAHRVTVVDMDARALARVGAAMDVQLIEGHAADCEVLVRAGASTADLVVAATNNDELNMLASLFARRLGARRTVVRVHASKHVLDNQYFYKDTLGFDLTVSPEEISAWEILRVCRGQNALPVENFAGGRLQMRRVEISEASPAAGKRFGDLKLHGKLVPTAVIRGAEVTILRGDYTLASGDFVVLSGVPEALDKAEKQLGGKRDLPKRVILVGGGTLALLIARELKALGVSVRLIVETDEAAEAMLKGLSGSEIVRGRGTDLDLLGQEAIHRADFFISVGPSDEENLLSCQLAKSAGAQRTIALVNQADYAALVDRLGIDHAVSPRRLVARRIAHFVRADSDGCVMQIHHGAAEILDKQIPRGSRLVDRTIQECALPVGTVVAGVVRDDEVIIPRGDTVLEAGDHVILFALREVLRDVEEFFGSRDSALTAEGAPAGS